MKTTKTLDDPLTHEEQEIADRMMMFVWETGWMADRPDVAFTLVMKWLEARRLFRKLYGVKT